MRAVSIAAVIAAGVAPAHAQVAATLYIDNDVAGDVQSGRLGVGASAGYYLGGWIGLELDGEFHGHFFRDEDVASRQPMNVDLNTNAALASGNLVVPYCLRGAAGTWCPYATGGLGVVYEIFQGTAHGPDVASFDHHALDFAANAGIGATHALTRWIGFRVDARYIHAFVDERSASATYPRDYGDWRVSVGVTFGGPHSQASP